MSNSCITFFYGIIIGFNFLPILRAFLSLNVPSKLLLLRLTLFGFSHNTFDIILLSASDRGVVDESLNLLELEDFELVYVFMEVSDYSGSFTILHSLASLVVFE